MNITHSVDDYELLKGVSRTLAEVSARSKGLKALNEICQNMLKIATAKYEAADQYVTLSNAQAASPQQDLQMPLPPMMPLTGDLGFNDHDPSAFNFMDFSMLDGWELGPGGAESAREMNTFFEQYPQGGYMSTG